MRELLYVPPGRRDVTGLIGVLVPELANPIFPALAQAIETPRRAEPASPRSSATRPAPPSARSDYVHMLLDRRVEGMIFISCEMTNLRGDHSHYAHLVAEGARIVFVNGAMHTLDVPSVGVDERAAGEIATQHLIDARPRADRLRRRAEHYSARRSGRPRARARRCARPASSRTASSRTPTSESKAAAGARATSLARPGGRRPASSARAT